MIDKLVTPVAVELADPALVRRLHHDVLDIVQSQLLVVRMPHRLVMVVM